MDQQFDFRALLLKIQDGLSNNDRHRLHFLVGHITPRMQRDDVTLAGTLTLLESLFDRAVISEDYLDFLIRIFREIGYYDAVKRLREYQLSKVPSQECKLAASVLVDNSEEDKCCSTPYGQLISEDNNSVPLDKPDVPKLNIKESLSIPLETGNTSDKSTVNTASKQTQKTFFKLRLIYYLYVLFFLQILALLIYLWIFVWKKLPANIIETRYHHYAYILKNGKFPDGIDGKWFNHSEDLLLTFADRLIHIDAYTDRDDMYSIKFIYSQNKSIKHQLRNITRLNQPTLSSLDLKKRSIQEITQCYKNNNGSKRLVGLFFAFKDKPSVLFGSCHDQIHENDKFSNHILGYALGRMDQHLTGFQFIWYKICPLHSRVTLCTNHNPYNLLSDALNKV